MPARMISDSTVSGLIGTEGWLQLMKESRMEGTADRRKSFNFVESGIWCLTLGEATNLFSRNLINVRFRDSCTFFMVEPYGPSGTQKKPLIRTCARKILSFYRFILSFRFSLWIIGTLVGYLLAQVKLHSIVPLRSNYNGDHLSKCRCVLEIHVSLWPKHRGNIPSSSI